VVAAQTDSVDIFTLSLVTDDLILPRRQILKSLLSLIVNRMVFFAHVMQRWETAKRTAEKLATCVDPETVEPIPNAWPVGHTGQG
jgi:hypothetical protein